MGGAVCLDGNIGDPDKFNDEETIKRLFLEHIEEVKNNVPAEQLYVMELGSGWEGLCKFLEKDVPKEPYPSVNSTNEFTKNFPLSEINKWVILLAIKKSLWFHHLHSIDRGKREWRLIA